jgi:putative RNA 2'-phosphotransferase
MGRSFVHLTLDWRYADSVAQAKSSRGMVLIVQALEAHQAGVAFRVAGDHVWLADPTPPKFIRQPQNCAK